MECLDTTKSLKINFKRNIGTVLIVVEGAKDEFELLKHIFRDVLHYNYIEKSRNQKNFKNYDEFIMKGNENSRVIVINAKNSNLSSIKKDKEYLNEIYKRLYEEYGIDTKNINVYFLWDRDNNSNPQDITKNLLGILGNSLENKDEEMNGLLLLSYPSLESYLISNFVKDNLFLKEKNLKNYIKSQGYKINKIDKHTILKATKMMFKSLLDLGITEYDLDDFSKTSLDIFNKEEDIYNKRKYYNLLSLISIMLLDLNIITIKDS